MNTIEQVYEWLHIAFIEPYGRINEIFYYDKEANEFYSVFMTDYWLAEPDGEVENFPYSKEEWAVLSARMDRSEANDPSIVAVPQLNNEERMTMMQNFLNQEELQHNITLQSYIDRFENRNLMQRFIDNKNGSELDFGNQLPEEYQGKWEAFKRQFVRSYIVSFCNLHNINLETVTFFTNVKAISVTFKL